MSGAQRPLTADEITAGRGAFQIIWRDAAGKLYVHQMQGEVLALMLNTPESTYLRDKIFWHLKATFMSVGAAVMGLEAVQMEGEPPPPPVRSPILNAQGKAYHPPDDKGGGDPKPN